MKLSSVPPGYSGKPLATKLGVREGHRAAVIGGPRGFRALLGPVADAVEWKRLPVTDLDCVLLFAPGVARLEAGFERAAAALNQSGMLWVAWPKKASGVRTDLTEGGVRSHGLACGLVDVKVCAITETWAGLKFVRRLRDR